MKKLQAITLAWMAVAWLGFGSVSALAADDAIYGRELMSNQEIQQHRQKMRTLQGDERQQYRQEHHERMKERAKERGVTIPEEPGTGRKGMRQGQGMNKGSGMRQGQGMNKGSGMRQDKGMNRGSGMNRGGGMGQQRGR